MLKRDGVMQSRTRFFIRRTVDETDYDDGMIESTLQKCDKQYECKTVEKWNTNKQIR